MNTHQTRGGLRRPVSALLWAGLLAAGNAGATIVSGAISASNPAGGAFVKLAVPFTESTPDNTVGNNTFNTQNLYGFDESQNTTLTSALTPDQGAALANGTTVASHYIFYDPTSGTIRGTVTFDAKILAILSSTAALAATDYLANTGVTYLNPALRGLEPGDLVSFSGNTVSLDLTASSPGDYIRVLTEYSPGANVPEPGSVALAGVALAGLLASSRRRKAA